MHSVLQKTEKNTGLMTEGSIAKKLLLFAVPLILGNLLQQMYNTVDSMIVGNFVGSGALAAVGASTALINLLISFSQGISVGAGVLVSQSVGAQKQREIRRSVHTSMAFALLLGAVLSVAGVLLTPKLLIWMKTPDEVMGDSVTYLRIYSMGIFFNVIYNMEAGILNAVGNSRRSLLYLGTASVVNIILDLILIKGFGMGVEGAAVATDISQAVSCILALWYLVHVPESYRVHPAHLKIYRQTALKIVKVGLPTGVQNMVISLSNVLVQSSVNVFGATVMAGFGAYLKVDGFNILPVMSLSMAVTTFAGQNYGAGKIERVKKGMWTTLLISLGYTAMTGILLLTFSESVMSLFTEDEAVIQEGMSAMQYFCPFYFLLGIMHSFAGTVRGTGKTIPPMMILLFSLCGFRIAWLKLIFPLHHTIGTVFVNYPIAWAIGAVLMVLYTWKGNWLSDESYRAFC